MSLATYLGRSALTAGRPLPLQGDDEMPVKQVELSSPIVSDAVIEEMRTNEQLGFKLLDATFVLDGGTEALKTGLHALQAAAERAVPAPES